MNKYSFFKKGEVPLRIEFFPHQTGNVSIDDDGIKTPETLLIVEVTFLNSRKALGLTKENLNYFKKMDRDDIIPIKMLFYKLIHECVRDLKDKNQLPVKKTFSKYSKEFDNIINNATDTLLKLQFN